MDLDGARNAKAEILERVFGGTTDLMAPDLNFVGDMASGAFRGGIDPSSSVLRGAVGSLSITNALSSLAGSVPLAGSAAGIFSRRVPQHSENRRAAAPVVAIGIQRSRDRGGANLVLIASHTKFRTHPLVERAISLARGEAHFVAGGEPRPLSYWQPPRRRPLMLGTSLSHHQVQAGTLGAFVTLADDTIGVISNNHVLAGVNKGNPGDPIVQPGKSDGGKAGDEDTIGTLLRFIPLVNNGPNEVDCAVASLRPDLAPSSQVVVGDREPPLRVTGMATDELFADDAVWKVGRTTGLTNGRVFAVEVDNFTVNMGTSWRPFRCRFDNQIQVYAEDRAFAGPGDSGSLLVDHDGHAHALLFAGSATGGPTGTGLATFNPFGLVLEKLDATLWIG
jgi:hypothetical protein